MEQPKRRHVGARVSKSSWDQNMRIFEDHLDISIDLLAEIEAARADREYAEDQRGTKKTRQRCRLSF